MSASRLLLACVGAVAVMGSGCTLPAFSCALDTDCPPGFVCRAQACAEPSASDLKDAGTSLLDDAGTRPDGGVIDVSDAGDDDVDGGVPGGPDAGDVDDAGPDPGPDAGPDGDWWDVAWTRRVKLAIQSGPEALAEFPLLVTLDSAALDLSGAAVDGRDIRFIDADGVTELAHEIEAWKSPGVSSVWVKVPLIDTAPADDFVTMYFANDIAGDAQDRAAVWSEGYAGVWHLAGDPLVGVRDSSPNSGDGSALFGVGRDVGAIGDAFTFNGGSVVRIDGSAQGPLDLLGPLTLSAWVRPDGFNGGSILARREGGLSQWQLEVEAHTGSVPQASLIYNDTSGFQCIWSTDEGLEPGVWRHISVAIDELGDPVTFTIDGVSVSFGLRSSCAGGMQSQDIDVAIGARWAGVPNPGFAFAGAVDEARVETELRSSAWVAAQHRSMTNTLVTFGAIESVP